MTTDSFIAKHINAELRIDSISANHLYISAAVITTYVVHPYEQNGLQEWEASLVSKDWTSGASHIRHAREAKQDVYTLSPHLKSEKSRQWPLTQRRTLLRTIIRA